MIRIQKLKEPKKTSGHCLEKGKTFTLKGVAVKNNNSFAIYVDSFERKALTAKKAAKKKSAGKKSKAKKFVPKMKAKAASPSETAAL